jgi:hypothetical protein
MAAEQLFNLLRSDDGDALQCRFYVHFWGSACNVDSCSHITNISIRLPQLLAGDRSSRFSTFVIPVWYSSLPRLNDQTQIYFGSNDMQQQIKACYTWVGREQQKAISPFNGFLALPMGEKPFHVGLDSSPLSNTIKFCTHVEGSLDHLCSWNVPNGDFIVSFVPRIDGTL